MLKSHYGVYHSHKLTSNCSSRQSAHVRENNSEQHHVNATVTYLIHKKISVEQQKILSSRVDLICVLIGSEPEHNLGPVNSTVQVLDNQSHAYQVTR